MVILIAIIVLILIGQAVFNAIIDREYQRYEDFMEYLKGQNNDEDNDL